MTKHLISSADLTRAEVEDILETAASMHDLQRREVKKVPTLRGRTIINFFFEDSTRTRSSFEIAGKWMSADTINLSAKGSSTSKGESLRDTAMTVDAMAVDEDGETHGARSPELRERVEGGADRAAGVEHVVDEHDDLVVDAARRDVRSVGHAHGVAPQVVAVQRDVELADRDLGALDVLDAGREATGEGDPARRDAEEHEPLAALVALEDLVTDAP